MRYLYIIFSFVSLCLTTNAQNFQLEDTQYDFIRIKKIINQDSTNDNSFNIRNTNLYWSIKLDTINNKSGFNAKLLFLNHTVQHNSNLPIGFNDRNFIPSVGLQQKSSIAMLIKWGKLRIHLQPELISSQNLPGEEFIENPTDSFYRRDFYWNVRNKIDNAFKFGSNTPFTSFNLGQSSIRYQSKTISFGISNENLWWGPGLRNSLILTNNASGFLHFTFNTIKPIRTRLGQIEFQSIYGQLDSSRLTINDFDNFNNNSNFVEKKINIHRRILGYVISWKPKWFEGLFIGMAGARYFYNSEVIPLPSPNILSYENRLKKESLSSIFFRYQMPKDNAEIYMEFGRAKKFIALPNLIGDTIPTAYTVGLRKAFLLKSKKGFPTSGAILVSIELTKLQLPDNRLIFNSNNITGVPKTNSWYTSSYIKQGYTNQGQVIGASIGPGSNSQTLSISWLKGYKKLSFNIERINYNADFYQYHYFNGRIGKGNPSNYWVDINTGFQFQWDFDNFLFNASYLYTSSLNYRWTKLGGNYADPAPLSDKDNHQLSLSIVYLIKRSFK